MVTLVEFMLETEYLMIKMPDMYEIMQMYAKTRGLQVGQVFDCKTGDFIRNLTKTEIKYLMQKMQTQQKVVRKTCIKIKIVKFYCE